ncbi:MAG: hypothetical protein FWD89_04825 [Firmicutes bacterium]|nr:hypothetical protein [Bacillota bacterium]
MSEDERIGRDVRAAVNTMNEGLFSKIDRSKVTIEKELDKDLHDVKKIIRSDDEGDESPKPPVQVRTPYVPTREDIEKEQAARSEKIKIQRDAQTRLDRIKRYTAEEQRSRHEREFFGLEHLKRMFRSEERELNKEMIKQYFTDKMNEIKDIKEIDRDKEMQRKYEELNKLNNELEKEKEYLSSDEKDVMVKEMKAQWAKDHEEYELMEGKRFKPQPYIPETPTSGTPKAEGRTHSM